MVNVIINNKIIINKCLNYLKKIRIPCEEERKLLKNSLNQVEVIPYRQYFTKNK